MFSEYVTVTLQSYRWFLKDTYVVFLPFIWAVFVFFLEGIGGLYNGNKDEIYHIKARDHNEKM